MLAAAGGDNVNVAAKPLIMQSAIGVGLCAEECIKKGAFTGAAELTPAYLKLPQAERELKQRKGEQV